MIDLGGGTYLDLVVPIWVSFVLAVVLVPPFLLVKWVRK